MKFDGIISIKFRNTENDIRAYFELGFEKCKQDIFKEIIIGPKCKMADLDIRLLLAKNGYIEDIFLPFGMAKIHEIIDSI